jgi:hypothetical protein
VVNRFSLSENTFLQATGAKDSAHGETYMYAEKGLWGVSLGKWLKSATYKRTALADVERRVFCSGVDLRRCIFWARFNVLRRQRRHGGNEYTG